jgi:DNA helicase HerA-like ATPase
MLSELFEQLPEIGDPDKPKLVFFFDEAHLLFNDAPKALLEKIEQVVRLIRSKGVGVYFVTQNPLDVPESVLGQLGNRVQHALRAFTPRDQRAVKTAATTMRPNPGLDIERAITELGVGEALVSLLDEKGRPGITERAFVVPPGSQIGPITPQERQQIIEASAIFGHYEKAVDRESAYEILTEQKASAQAAPSPGKPGSPPAAEQDLGSTVFGTLKDFLLGSTGPRGGRREGILESVAKSEAKKILRGALGGILGGRRR